MQRLTHATVVAALLAGTALGSGVARAQSAAAGGGTLELDAISVSATRDPGPAFSYPGMVTVIEREAIDGADPSSAGDLFRATPGVFFDGGPRRTGQVPSIRGAQGENVQVRIDGTRQNFISGHDGRFFLDPEMLGGAEVLRGPASSLYGSGAIGGVMSFRTLDTDDLLAPGETVGGRAKVGYQGVNDEFMTSLVAAGRPSADTDVVAGLGAPPTTSVSAAARTWNPRTTSCPGWSRVRQGWATAWNSRCPISASRTTRSSPTTARTATRSRPRARR